MAVSSRALRTADEYEEVVAEMDRLVPYHTEADADRFELLSILARDYEARTMPLRQVSPIDAIEFALEERGLDRSALIGVIGGRGRVSEVMNRHRRLTNAMIARLQAQFGIPREILTRDYLLAPRAKADETRLMTG